METRINDHNIRRQIYSYLSRGEKTKIANSLRDLVLYESLLDEENKSKVFEIKHVIEEEDEDDYCTRIEIKVKNIGLSNKFYLYDPGVFSIEEWEEFGKYVLNGKCKSMMFCGSDGHVELRCDEKYILFRMAKYGAGGDGELENKLDRKIYANHFYEEIMKLVNNPDFRRLYK